MPRTRLATASCRAQSSSASDRGTGTQTERGRHLWPPSPLMRSPQVCHGADMTNRGCFTTHDSWRLSARLGHVFVRCRGYRFPDCDQCTHGTRCVLRVWELSGKHHAQGGDPTAGLQKAATRAIDHMSPPGSADLSLAPQKTSVYSYRIARDGNTAAWRIGYPGLLEERPGEREVSLAYFHALSAFT